MTNTLELSIIIVNWNSWFHLHRCLHSILQQAADIPHEVIVVDNHSADGSPQKIQEAFPGVRCLALQENLGFPKATNVGLALAQGRFLLALNPDTELGPGALEASIHFLSQHQGYGCVGVKTLKPNGAIQFDCARRKMSLKGVILETLMLDKLFRCAWLDSPAMTEWDHESDADVDIIQGAYMLFPRTVYQQLGGLDETLPMFYEDMEFCLRLAENGYKIRYLSQVQIIHHIGQSTGKAVARWVADLRYEAYFLALQRIHGLPTASRYPLLLLLILPVKILLSPALALGIYLNNGHNRLRTILVESIYGLGWVARKVFMTQPACSAGGQGHNSAAPGE